jgi:uncharacterized protein YdhG (YjbR/CyaY superfamily)
MAGLYLVRKPIPESDSETRSAVTGPLPQLAAIDRATREQSAGSAPASCRAAASGHGFASMRPRSLWKGSPHEVEGQTHGGEEPLPKHRMRCMKQSVPKSVDEYIAAQPETVRPKLEQVRAAIRRAVPEAEGIGYRMPGYKLHGKPMLYFAGFKEHYSLFAASGTFFAALEDELRGYELRKGTVHFPLTKSVPVKLISRIAKLRAAGIAATTKEPLLGRDKGRRKSAK